MADCVICLFCGVGNDYNVSSYAIATDNPPAWSEAYDLPSNLYLDLGIALGYATRPETSATGNGTATITHSRNVGQLVAIAPPFDSGPVVATPDTLALALTFYAPTITISGNKLVIPTTLALTLTFYAPIVSIGSKNLDVFIDGERIIIERKSLRIHTGIEERSTAQFNIIDRLGTSNHKKGQPVEIYDLNNTLIFGGVIEEPGKTRLFKSGGLYYSIHCIDWHYLADKRIAAATYLGETAGFIFNDLVTNYLAAEGITVGEIQDGPTLVQATINYVKVSEALDALAEKAGFIWFIDENKKIYFIDRTTNDAPWTAEYPYLEPTPALSEGNPLYRNRQYIRGAKALTSEQVETLTGDGNIKAFVVGFPIAQEPAIEVDGDPQDCRHRRNRDWL